MFPEVSLLSQAPLTRGSVLYRASCFNSNSTYVVEEQLIDSISLFCMKKTRLNSGQRLLLYLKSREFLEQNSYVTIDMMRSASKCFCYFLLFFIN